MDFSKGWNIKELFTMNLVAVDLINCTRRKCSKVIVMEDTLYSLESDNQRNDMEQQQSIMKS